ncbi:hypothetical protein FisN_4Hu318 [Fistulifera solaris]|uniref:Transmembrane protein 186 n=1 Tax=Fistulifera solaris TaxID=1519565 RepID=A0A1Z5KEK8_FISSO|nr:hypothetical protein FisN_4Hu318 [Fistulifera solaris]|eukprot:GAX24760.1 hypothetical protein FisN_4Hu318 [Fistulifera solaris]
MKPCTAASFLLFTGSAMAFSPNRIAPLSTTQLAVSNSLLPNSDPYDKAIPRKGEHQTKPVATYTPSWMERLTMPNVMIEPDYFLTIGVALLCPLIIWYHPSYTEGPSIIGVSGGLFHLLFAALLGVQTRRVRCVFEKDAFEFYNLKGPGLQRLEIKPDNYVAGTRNRWKYDSIINYGFFPSEQFPVICYFKETETPEWKWNRWFAAFDSYQNGQPHFFPGICNVQQFKAEMEKRGVKRKPVPTFKAKSNSK